MAMQWFTPRDLGSAWVSKSSDGYYAVGVPCMGEYGAYHIEAAFATPKQIAVAPSIADAQAECEKHAGRNRAPASNHPKG